MGLAFDIAAAMLGEQGKAGDQGCGLPITYRGADVGVKKTLSTVEFGMGFSWGGLKKEKRREKGATLNLCRRCRPICSILPPRHLPKAPTMPCKTRCDILDPDEVETKEAAIG